MPIEILESTELLSCRPCHHWCSLHSCQTLSSLFEYETTRLISFVLQMRSDAVVVLKEKSNRELSVSRPSA